LFEDQLQRQRTCDAVLAWKGGRERRYLPGIENDRREKIDKEELLIELQNVRISTLAYQQHNYSTTKPLYRECIHITPCM
jgi:hypothetical protein